MDDKQISVKRLDDEQLRKFRPSFIKMCECGNVTEFVLMAQCPQPIPILKLSKDTYCLIDENGEPGEVMYYNRSETKDGSIQSVKRTLANLRRIINKNCSDDKKLRWVTLTYAENMRDTTILYNDFKCFWQKFKRWSKSKNFEIPEYISVAEPQGRGAWHLHLIFVYQNNAPYINNNVEFAPLWGHGFTKIKAVHGIDNLGAYFSAYLADMPLEEFERLPEDKRPYNINYKSVSDDDGKQKQKKAFVKGGRLNLYPSGMNIYRCSKGIQQPTVEEIDIFDYKDIKNDLGKQTYIGGTNIYSVEDGQEILLNTVIHEFYNLKRK